MVQRTTFCRTSESAEQTDNDDKSDDDENEHEDDLYYEDIMSTEQVPYISCFTRTVNQSLPGSIDVIIFVSPLLNCEIICMTVCICVFCICERYVCSVW